ncbi:MAG: hypothetical protein ABEI96_09170 [Haloarculaceae archaeon]
MSRSGARRVVLVLLVGVVVGASAGAVAPGVAAQQATRPTVDVAIDGTPVANGSVTYVGSSVSVTLDAAVGDGADEDVTLRSVAVRVNHTTIYRSNISAESVSVTQPAALSTGNNTVTVAVTDSTGATATKSVTVYRDERAPRIRLTGPATLADDTPRRGSTLGTSVTIEGVITDDVAFDHGSIEVFHQATTYHSKTPITSADFSKTIRLGRGDNTVVVSATDSQGNTRTYRVVLAVTDTVDPTVTLHGTDAIVHDDTYTVDATVTDAVWIRRTAVRVEHRNAPGRPEDVYVVAPDRRYEVSDERKRVDVHRKVPLTLGQNRITVRAVDHRGHVTKESIVVEYYPETDEQPRTSLREDGTYWLPPNVSQLNGTRVEPTNTSFWSEANAGKWVNGSFALDRGTFRVDAIVTDDGHDLDHVTLEVRRLDGDRTRVLTRNFQVRGQQRARVFADLNLSFDVYEIQLLAVDRRGKSTLTEFRIGPPPTDIEYVSRLSGPGFESTRTPTTTDAPTATTRPTTADRSEATTASSTTWVPSTTRVPSTAAGSATAGSTDAADGGGGVLSALTGNLFVLLYAGVAVLVVGTILGVVLLRR